MRYIILVLTCVLLGLNCSQLCVCCCSSMERRGAAAAAFIPLHSTTVGNLASEQHTDWPVCPGQSGTCAAAGVSWIMIPLTALKSCRKAGWRIGRAAKWGGGDMQEVKGPSAVTSSSSCSWLGRQRGTRLPLACIDSFCSVLEWQKQILSSDLCSLMYWTWKITRGVKEKTMLPSNLDVCFPSAVR